MPELTPDRRSQLDGIVSQMVANGESDSNIKTVVEDFKGKYAGPPGIQKPNVPGLSDSGPDSWNLRDFITGKGGLIREGASEAVNGIARTTRGGDDVYGGIADALQGGMKAASPVAIGAAIPAAVAAPGPFAASVARGAIGGGMGALAGNVGIDLLGGGEGMKRLVELLMGGAAGGFAASPTGNNVVGATWDALRDTPTGGLKGGVSLLNPISWPKLSKTASAGIDNFKMRQAWEAALADNAARPQNFGSVRGAPAWAGINPQQLQSVDATPIPGSLPSGRVPGGFANQQPIAAPPPMPGTLSPTARGPIQDIRSGPIPTGTINIQSSSAAPVDPAAEVPQRDIATLNEIAKSLGAKKKFDNLDQQGQNAVLKIAEALSAKMNPGRDTATASSAGTGAPMSIGEYEADAMNAAPVPAGISPYHPDGSLKSDAVFGHDVHVWNEEQAAQRIAEHLRKLGITPDALIAMRNSDPARYQLVLDTIGKTPGISSQADYSPSNFTMARVFVKLRNK